MKPFWKQIPLCQPVTCNWIALETETKLKTVERNARHVELIHAYLSYLTKHKCPIKQNLTSNEANQAIYPIIPFLPHAWLKLEHKKKIAISYDENLSFATNA